MYNNPHFISALSIAPMIDWTYSHFRVFMRMLAPRALLYTDMQTPNAIRHNPTRTLHFHASETPLALQLGGSNREELVFAARLAEREGYKEVNINLGCPSDRVQKGQFGACLMANKELVADCIKALKDAVGISVTAKTRIGIDATDSYEFFSTFVHHLIEAGCDKLIVHARKAWLHGLNPKQNRTIPPLHYDYVYRIKKSHTNIPVIINGNIHTMDDITHHLNHVDGVMLGRLACQNPYAIATIHHELFKEHPLRTRSDVLQQYHDYVTSIFNKNNLSLLLKPIFNLAHALPGARHFKEQLMITQKSGSLQGLEDAVKLLDNLERQN